MIYLLCLFVTLWSGFGLIYYAELDDYNWKPNFKNYKTYLLFAAMGPGAWLVLVMWYPLKAIFELLSNSAFKVSRMK